MKGRKKFLIGILCVILSGLLVAPALAQKKEGSWERFKEGKAKVIKGLNLAPEKQKELTAVEEKFGKERKEIFESLKKDYDQLEKEVAAAKPEEMKVKEQVAVITATQDKLFATFKSQRSGELALMTPVQQGRYLLGLRKLYHESMGLHFKPGEGKAAPKTPEKK